jgi:iron complex outermembrane receptor protein
LAGALLRRTLPILVAVLVSTAARPGRAQTAPAPAPAPAPPAAPPAPPPAPPAAPPAAPPVAPPAAPSAYETVVTATTPLHGSGLPIDRVPSNVQTATGAGIARAQSLDLAEYMNGELGSVHVNQVQDNPLQADLQYRGFVASPLLGAPQGLSVYWGGVRLNEIFGDTVNWDLIPSNAIRTLNLMPGSNPLFGMNTLGGALSIETKTGFSDPGAQVRLSGGSFNRRAVDLQMGAHGEHLAYYIAAELFREDGWRQASSSEAARVLLATTYHRESTTVDLTLAAAESDLNGNGPAPVQLLAEDRTAVFTYPDRTGNRLFLASLRAERAVGARARLSGVAYLRRNRAVTLNGDQGQWARCQDPVSATLVCAVDDSGAEIPVTDRNGNGVPFDDVHPYDAADNGTRTAQVGYGATGQLAVEAPLGARENHLFIGASGNEGRAHFTSQSALARLSSTRGTLPTEIVDPTSLVDVESVTRNLGLFASDTLAVLPDLFLTVSGRYNIATLSLADQQGGDLSGDDTFERLNPAVGLSYQPRPAIGVFGGYSESTRAPTALELTCASATAPCRLPNGFVSDPPLEQVVARTFEIGVRGRLTRPSTTLTYDVAAFRTTNDDDIIFISAGPVTNQGYFTNVGQTRRQGVESGVVGRIRLGARGGRLEASLHYTWLDARFETPFSALSVNHPDAVAGVLTVPAGARLPSTPRHIGKATLTWTYADRLSLGASAIANSSQFRRGDEANLLEPVAGYIVVDLRASYDVAPPVSLFLKVSNVLDARYATFGALGDAATVLGPTFDNPRFDGPGAPRAAWAGLVLRY